MDWFFFEPFFSFVRLNTRLCSSISRNALLPSKLTLERRREASSLIYGVHFGVHTDGLPVKGIVAGVMGALVVITCQNDSVRELSCDEASHAH